VNEESPLAEKLTGFLIILSEGSLSFPCKMKQIILIVKHDRSSADSHYQEVSCPLPYCGADRLSTGRKNDPFKHRAEESKDVLYLDLELPSDIAKFQDPELYLSQFSGRLVIIDEIQRIPDLFPLLRSLVDKNMTPKRFLIPGSASPDLIKQASETLAGRTSFTTS